MKSIFTDKAPNVVGPYSQAIEHGEFVFCSGQIGLNPATGKLVEGIENQTNQIMSNLEQVLIAASSSLNKIVKTTIFLADINDYVIVNEIYGSYFPEIKPARSTFQVANLPAKALIEIECIAFK